ncbi:MAG: hypothetical protein QM617_05020 [Comamonas sp.]
MDNRHPFGHYREFVLSDGTSGSLECAHVVLDGRFTRFLWIELYDAHGECLMSACKLNPHRRWRSGRCIPDRTLFEQIRSMPGYMPGRWARIEIQDGRAAA